MSSMARRSQRTSLLYKLDAEAYGDWSITVLLQMIVVNLILKAVQKPMRSECF